MNVLVCIKRVPQVGDRIALTGDGQAIDAKNLGFTFSPHEECGVEEAVRIVEKHGGAVTVLTLGPAEAVEQLRTALALGAQQAVLLETDGGEWGPAAVADAIAAVVRAKGPFDLVIFGNESADTGNYQIGIRVAHRLGLPVVTGIKALDVDDGAIRARREYRGTGEVFELPLPAVVTVKEGINLPRYPSLPGRIRAKKAPVDQTAVSGSADGVRKQLLRVPAATRSSAEVLGSGVDAVPRLVEVLAEIGVTR